MQKLIEREKNLKELESDINELKKQLPVSIKRKKTGNA
jgi:ribosomal protein L29